MKVLIFIAVLFIFPQAWAQSFFENLPDVPLMAGLVEIEEWAIAFDKPEGRIVSAAAFIDDSISVESLQAYYDKALPQFGWQKAGEMVFERGQEMLKISIQNDHHGRIIEIIIVP